MIGQRVKNEHHSCHNINRLQVFTGGTLYSLSGARYTTVAPQPPRNPGASLNPQSACNVPSKPIGPSQLECQNGHARPPEELQVSKLRERAIVLLDCGLDAESEPKKYVPAVLPTIKATDLRFARLNAVHDDLTV